MRDKDEAKARKEDAEESKREKNRSVEQRRIQEIVHNFITGEQQDKTIIHKWADMEIIGDTLYYIRTGNVYIPVCKKMPGAYYILNTWGFDDVSRSNIDEMCITEINLREIGKRNNRVAIIRLTMKSNTGTPKTELNYKEIDAAAQHFIFKLGAVQSKIEHLTKDPEYNIAESIEELEEEAEDLKGAFNTVKGLAHHQKQQENKEQLEWLIWYKTWAKGIVEGDDVYNPEENNDVAIIKSVIETRDKVVELTQEYSKYIMALQEIARHNK